jgi:hypothetical protein
MTGKEYHMFETLCKEVEKDAEKDRKSSENASYNEITRTECRGSFYAKRNLVSMIRELLSELNS